MTYTHIYAYTSLHTHKLEFTLGKILGNLRVLMISETS